MNRISKFWLLLLITSLALSAYAQSPGEQLQQMVGQLQKTPADNPLREKIIKLAQTLQPAPTVPDEAIKFEGRAQAAFKAASGAEDYLTAAFEYRKAVSIAPWVGGYYADLCTIYEQAGVYVEAKRNCLWAAMADSDPKAAVDSKRKIAGLEFLSEKFSKEKLSAQLDEPFNINIPTRTGREGEGWGGRYGLPAGKKYFCSARWDFPFSTGYSYNPDDPPVGGRRETWFVYDGKILSIGSVLWAEPESLAAFILHQRSSDYPPPSFINPTVLMSEDKPYPGGSPTQFYSQGITSFYLAEVSADGNSVTMIQRGGSPDQPRAEEGRRICKLR